MTTIARQAPPGPPNGLARKVDAAIQKHRLLANNQRILVGVSGGLDSMVLLHILKDLAPARGWRLVVAHYNHGLRGRSSNADEALVVRTASRLNLPVVVGRGRVKEVALKLKQSIEMAARELRHKFLASTAHRRRISTVVLAHHAGDQAELFFLRLLRGTATEGLAGMRPDSPSPADRRVRIVRPLLEIDRASLEKFAAEHHVHFRHDASNFDKSFLRNRVRHELLPLLKNYQPALEQTVSRLMEIARSESDLAGRLAVEWLKAPRGDFRNLDVAVQRRCMAMQLIAHGSTPEFELVERLRNSPETPVSAPGGYTFIMRRLSGLLEIPSAQKPGFDTEHKSASLLSHGAVDFGPVHFQWTSVKGNSLPAKKIENCEFFDAGLVGGQIVLRHWRPGDRFQPIGMPAPVKLQDLLTNAKVPVSTRVRLSLAEDAAGRIFWVEGCRISEPHKVTPATRKMLKWEWRRLKPAVAAPASKW